MHSSLCKGSGMIVRREHLGKRPNPKLFFSRNPAVLTADLQHLVGNLHRSSLSIAPLSYILHLLFLMCVQLWQVWSISLFCWWFEDSGEYFLEVATLTQTASWLQVLGLKCDTEESLRHPLMFRQNHVCSSANSANTTSEEVHKPVLLILVITVMWALYGCLWMCFSG